MHALAAVLALQLQIPSLVGYVNDFARVMDPASAAAVQRVIDEVRAKPGGEIVVVTLFVPLEREDGQQERGRTESAP